MYYDSCCLQKSSAVHHLPWRKHQSLYCGGEYSLLSRLLILLILSGDWLCVPWVSAVILKRIQVSESMAPSYPRALMFDFICVPLSRMFHEAPLFSSGTFSIRLILTPAYSIALLKCLITQYPNVLKWTLNAVTEGYQYWTDHHKCQAKHDHQFSKAQCVSYHFHNCDKRPDRNTVKKKKKEYLFGLTVSDISPHGGREDLVEHDRYMMAAWRQGTSSPNGQGICMCLATEAVLPPTTALSSLGVLPPPHGVVS